MIRRHSDGKPEADGLRGALKTPVEGLEKLPGIGFRHRGYDGWP